MNVIEGTGSIVVEPDWQSLFDGDLEIAAAREHVGLGLLTWSHHAAYRAGQAAERAKILARSVEILRERNRVDDEISAFDDMALCNALGGVWMPSDGSCI